VGGSSQQMIFFFSSKDVKKDLESKLELRIIGIADQVGGYLYPGLIESLAY
jgi:hypothetical protein